ncbi:hypothetical protein Nepgr_002497 [Nepenthes gracilis]|uniref:EDR1/CTR1/ARMC3-like peptidase-like domain-containing protein n=1 Tax=Nepenthes gracilis TaxID=150966 RepID=A0AAD3P726_NEPGR|nr:hypothetical protein Nepgr_002497 [Nepenthes gracilis]
MANLRTAMDAAFWDLNIASLQNLDGYAKAVPGEPFPIDGALVEKRMDTQRPCPESLSPLTGLGWRRGSFWDLNISSLQNLDGYTRAVHGEPFPTDGARAGQVLLIQQLSLLRNGFPLGIIPSFSPYSFNKNLGSFSLQTLLLRTNFSDCLAVGLCRHRALLFRVMDDTIDLSCRIAKGCKYYHKDDATSCFVWFEPDRGYLVDLIENPGCLSEPDSLLNGPPSTSISSPLRFPQFRLEESAIDFKSLANHYFSDCQPLNTILENASTSSVVNEEDVEASMLQKQLDMNMMLPDRNNQESCSIMKAEPSQLPMPSTANQPTERDKSLKCRHPYQNNAWKWKWKWIVEFLSNGSLYGLLHKPGTREKLDEKRHLNVAKGMHYLHKQKLPIVHRALTAKSEKTHHHIRCWWIPWIGTCVAEPLHGSMDLEAVSKSRPQGTVNEVLPTTTYLPRKNLNRPARSTSDLPMTIGRILN